MILIQLLLTHNLQTTVWMNFPDISGTKPALPRLVQPEVVIFSLPLTPIVSHGNIRSTKQNLPSWVRLILTGVST